MSKQSENMMDLLKELAVLKELDENSSRESSQNEVEARQNRRQEIANQIKTLGETAG